MSEPSDFDVIRRALETSGATRALEALDRIDHWGAYLRRRAAAIERAAEGARREQRKRLAEIDDGDDDGAHVGIQRHRKAVYEGRAEVLDMWERALEVGQV